MAALRILINGGKGRMGHAVAAAAKDLGMEIGGVVDIGDNLAAAVATCDVVVDFSSHHATRSLLDAAVACQKPVVLGTTGHSAEDKQQLLRLAAKVPCVWAGNFSVGVNLLFA